MSGTWILLILLIGSALPAIIVFFWFRVRKPALSLPWFLSSLAAGIFSFIVAAFIQSFFSPLGHGGLGTVFFHIFVRIALLEEASRIITLIPFIIFVKKLRDDDRTFGAALGLAAGLGFALIESAFHGISNINITLLRAFTTAPLHGACGIRAGAAVFSFQRSKGKAIFCFISAIFIHGAYNLAIVSPAFPSILAILIAIAAFLSSLAYIRTTKTNHEVLDHF